MNYIETIEDNEPKPRRKVLEPQNQWEFCVAFGKITGLGTGRFLRMTKGFKMETFFVIQSYAKASKDQAASINSWFKDYRKSIKEI